MPDETRVRILGAEQLDAPLTHYDEDNCGDFLALRFAQDNLSTISRAPAPSQARAAPSQSTGSSKERTVTDKDWLCQRRAHI